MNIYLVNILTAFIVIFGSYIFGSIPNGVVIGKLFFRKDPRDFYSHNSGATNSGRVFGKTVGVIVSALDMLKAVILVYGIWALTSFTPLKQFYVFETVDLRPWYYWGAALFATIGHCYSIFLKFDGGKAVSCFMGVCMLTSWLGLAIATFYLLTLLVRKIVSLSSIIGGFAEVIMAWVLAILSFSLPVNTGDFFWTFWISDGLQAGLAFAIFMTIAYVILVVKHIPNIKRLIDGNEREIHI